MVGYGRYIGPAELLGFLADNGYPLAESNESSSESKLQMPSMTR